MTAADLFGLPGGAVAGRDVCDVLLAGPGQRELAARRWPRSPPGGSGPRRWPAVAGDGRFAIRCEPLAGPGGGAW